MTISILSLTNLLWFPFKMKYRNKPVTARIIIAMPMKENVLKSKAMYYGQWMSFLECIWLKPFIIIPTYKNSFHCSLAINIPKPSSFCLIWWQRLNRSHVFLIFSNIIPHDVPNTSYRQSQLFLIPGQIKKKGYLPIKMWNSMLNGYKNGSTWYKSKLVDDLKKQAHTFAT